MAAGPTIGADNASSFIGKDATVCGKVDSAKYNENSDGQPTFLHLGGKFPVHKFAIRIMGENRGKFTPPPEENLGRMVCVSGRVGRAAGNRAEMEVVDPSELQLL
ncbi:hypothetical protein IFO71_03060 [Pseudoxanthomonas sp. CAU 1598]|uniref:Uncharacterized protein n=2 Tax=Pseudomarimonas arenosa TaxID=2774145 RepID=A0AAW3ZJS1_9GAMM|nr:hypothetical protein [Pseudomarimonas arenosa]